jgi:rRNA maturation RNase YbeY
LKGQVDIFYNEVEILDLDPEFFVLWLGAVCSAEGRQLGALNIVFCSDEFLLEMNKSFLNHDYYTDIITFEDSAERLVNGELYISLDRVRDNTKKLEVNFKEEIYRVVVHGVLHLCGYKDKLVSEEELMRVKENEYLKLVSRET